MMTKASRAIRTSLSACPDAQRLIIRYVMVALGGMVCALTCPAYGQLTEVQAAAARHRLVDTAIEGEGISNKAVLRATRTVPRHEFVLASLRSRSYRDEALAIGAGQTISPPFVVAYMTETLNPQPSDKVLEIGTGSGY